MKINCKRKWAVLLVDHSKVLSDLDTLESIWTSNFKSTDRPVYMSLTVYFRDSQPDQFYLGSFNPDRRCSEYEWEYFIVWSYWLFIGRDAYTQLDPRCFSYHDWYMDYPSENAKFQHKKDWLELLDRSPSGLPWIYSKKPSCIPKTRFFKF